MSIQKFILSFVLFVLMFINVNAQVFSSVIVPGDTLDIGRPFDLGFSLFAPDPSVVKSIDLRSIYDLENLIQQDTSLPPEIVDLEISSYGTWPVNQEQAYPKAGDWTKTNQGYRLIYTLQAIIWDYGVYEINGLEATIDSTSNLSFGEPRYLFVRPPKPFETQDSTAIIADIKPIIEEPAKPEDFYWIGYLLIGLLAAFGIYKFLTRKKDETKVVEAEPEVIIPAHEIAIEKLNALKHKELWQKGEIKAYQSELTFIIREYLENRYEVKALESTTDQILKALKEVDFDQSNKDNLRDILTMADLVKFAKAKPGESIHETFMSNAIELIKKTKSKIKLDNAE